MHIRLQLNILALKLFLSLNSSNSLSIQSEFKSKALIFYLLNQFHLDLSCILLAIIIWTSIDLSSCCIRLIAITLNLLGNLSFYNLNLNLLNQIPFNQINFFLNHPYRATSLAEFWSKRWHNLLRQIFIDLGSNPAIWLLKSLNIHSKRFITWAQILGAFFISALIHEFALWYATKPDFTFKTSIFFISQGLAVCLESTFKHTTGKKVGGLIGRIWTFTYLIYFAKPCVQVWIDQRAIDIDDLNYKFNQTTWKQLIFIPMSVQKLLLSDTQSSYH
ncbi:hypothetical protein O181_083182 [Austropuccinia psidii MF-1]|uniref:Wax synthase domain-containing protein n=1 Tax=Austropuccinia psidii MF-1 TaxID=1389203 RepID=A0A9Q3FTY2_9BASI|nr:hypothetical protein [Austropuccinia psidii MF-1]